ncbi:hypothetical protein PENSPDRAFT_654492 [Peniophora sp. CONT]|nr:hypothetical protein PENSPDRAFT_654492 [Peniophora sp. CONT]
MMTALPAHAPGFEPMPLPEIRNLRNLDPPFPSTVPTGMTLLSFTDFQASSSIIYVDENDERVIPDDEHDGLGVAVVQLPTHAKPEANGIIGKRRKKRKAQVLSGTGVRRPWWEVWEDHESVRRKLYDHRLAPSERLLLAAHDFKEGRLGVWPQPGSGVQNLWDQLKMYLGLPLNRDSIQTKSRDYSMDEEDEDSDTGFDDMEITATHAPEPPSHLVELVLGDPKTESFLEDPEKSMKVFFSSHFRKQGNMYNVQHCLVFPKLVHFFLSYLLRSKVFPDRRTDAALRAAMSRTELAARELPIMSQIANCLPDDASKAFQTLWGPRRTGAMEADEQDRSIAQDVGAQEEVHEMIRKDKEEIEERRVKELEAARLEQIRVDKEKAEALQRRAEKAAAAEAAEKQAEGGDTVDGEVTSGWGDGGAVDSGEWGGESSGGWASSDSTWGASGGGWGSTSTDQDDDPWQSNAANSWGVPIATEQILDTTILSSWAPRTLLPFLGLTSLPLTHRPGVVERSTRRIKGVIWPAERKSCKVSGGPNAESVEEELMVTFARVVLEPWPIASSFNPPCILPSSHGKVDLHPSPVPNTTGHAPLRDTITVLVHPDSVPLLQSAVGMGLGATWTQIKRVEVVDGKKVKSKGAKDMWYMEELSQQVPSFWTEGVGEAE